MSVFFILTILMQVLLIVHVIRTGRNQIWIWVLALLPLAGAVAYIAVELLPAAFGSRAARRTARGFRRALDPQAQLRRYRHEAEVQGNVASRQRYAEELTRHGQYAEAIGQYRQALTGLYEHDPNLLLGLAQAQFGQGDFAAARATLDALIRANPDFRSPAGHLLYARALEGEGNVPKALEEYRVVAGSFPGAEAAVRYAQLLERQGQHEEARRVARELLQQARIAPGHYRRAQREWLAAAERLA
ncbi:MAG: tetratricopeptide repeat protein [Gammaproteobacteria bacterium]|nr:tetratricopeptide repeat protein [Gammaproteobacteria bacterium]MBV9696431.1 tetratricopeptide repeat protein [Gammaproteobacteria bacterium]